jgi:hypothetical protein
VLSGQRIGCAHLCAVDVCGEREGLRLHLELRVLPLKIIALDDDGRPDHINFVQDDIAAT